MQQGFVGHTAHRDVCNSWEVFQKFAVALQQTTFVVIGGKTFIQCFDGVYQVALFIRQISTGLLAFVMRVAKFYRHQVDLLCQSAHFVLAAVCQRGAEIAGSDALYLGDHRRHWPENVADGFVAEQHRPDTAAQDQQDNQGELHQRTHAKPLQLFVGDRVVDTTKVGNAGAISFEALQTVATDQYRSQDCIFVQAVDLQN